MAIAATHTIKKLDTSQIPAQREFILSQKPELLYSGAFGAGKSYIGNSKGYMLSQMYPGNRGLIVRKKFTDLRDTTMDTWFRYVMIPEHQEYYNKQEHRLVLKNGSEILFYGMDQESKIGSLEIGWAFADEVIEFTETDWMMLLGRLRLPNVPFHQIFAATNPANPYHWVYKRFYQNEELKEKGITHVVESDALSNPFTPQAYREKMLIQYRGKYRRRYIYGEWVSFEGLVYDVWDPSKHILTRDAKILPNPFDPEHPYKLTGDPTNPIPEDWEIFRAMDFGFTSPFVCQWWASKPKHWRGKPGMMDEYIVPWDERVWVMFQEVYHSGITIDDHAEEVVRNSDRRVVATFADWDAGDRALMEKCGVPTYKANKDVQAGIQTIHNMIGADRIYIMDDCVLELDEDMKEANKPQSTLEEFPGYERQKGKDGVKDPDEKPKKLNDHGMDSMRMLHHTLNIAHGPQGQFHSESSRPNPRVIAKRDVLESLPHHDPVRSRFGREREHSVWSRMTGERKWR